MQDSVSLTVAYLLGGLTLFPALSVVALVVLSIQRRKLIVPLFRSSSGLGPTRNEQTVMASGPFFQTGWVEATSSPPQTPSLTIKYMLKKYLFNNDNDHDKPSNSSSDYSQHYYAVLKFDTLFLYDSERQLDCRQVFVIHKHSVRMYPPGLKDHELFSRPTRILLTHDGKSLYINCSRNVDKEDWYLAFVNASKLDHKPHRTSRRLDSTRFDQTAMNQLLATIHSDEHHFHTQWLNSILGRIFFGLYKTDSLKTFFHDKICKKIEKLNARRPPFLDTIRVRSVNPGHALPYFTQPRLLNLSPAGEMTMEADVVYGGGFRFDIEAVLRWKYLDRLRPLTVNIVLAMTLKQIKGKVLLKIKEPPTNRIWVGFYEMPKMEWIVEPLVWDKRAGFSVVVKAIETKIQEIIAETMVLPNMDDFVFFPSNNEGGLFGTCRGYNNTHDENDEGEGKDEDEDGANVNNSTNGVVPVDHSEQFTPTEAIEDPDISTFSVTSAFSFNTAISITGNRNTNDKSKTAKTARNTPTNTMIAKNETIPKNILNHKQQKQQSRFKDESLWLMPEKHFFSDLFSSTPEMQTQYEFLDPRLVPNVPFNPSKPRTAGRVRRWFSLSKEGDSAKPSEKFNKVLAGNKLENATATSALPKDHPLSPREDLSSTASSIHMSEDGKDGRIGNDNDIVVNDSNNEKTIELILTNIITINIKFFCHTRDLFRFQRQWTSTLKPTVEVWLRLLAMKP
ncbi:putative integral membrane protein conserved region-domain-containing protein [Phycomyces blakesleeanus]|uniref:Integral membrane protein conserved region-domain-containing protein n=1 Tax=Phycomyces blakesleeanus TaxID=4837 RepID=A0ABR3AMZ8_PHYBL